MMIGDRQGFQTRLESYCEKLSLFILLYLDSFSYLD
jgi:hypothetical protein